MNSFSWLNAKLEAREVPYLEARGVFANQPIRKGERLAVFGGWVMALQDEPLGDFALQIAEDLVIGLRDPAQTEPAEFVNHSCDPNAGFNGQICLVAVRAIDVGEQVCFDYAMVLSIADYRFECRCGSPHCRGIVTGEDWKKTALQCRYTGYFSQYLQERIDGRPKK